MSEMSVEFKRRLFTVEEYHRLFERKFLTERDRVELIEGELIEMPPIGQTHVGRHARITAYLMKTIARRATVIPMGSFPLGRYSEPQPDLAIFPYDVGGFEGRPYPPPSEFIAFIEISDSSLAYDSKTKMRLYAAHGVSDYLLVDIRGNRLLAHREPGPDGYAACDVLGYGDRLRLTHLPEVELRADEFLAVRE